MVSHPNQPNAYDVVLGGQNPTPANGAVLGGFRAIERRLVHAGVEQRILALTEALKYGHKGLELAIEALKEESAPVRWAAYRLLQEREEDIARQALWEYSPYRLFQCLYRHSTVRSTAYSVAISPDGQTLLSGGSDKVITIRHLHAGRILRTFNGHLGSVYSVAISPDGKTLVSGGWDKTIKVWNLQTALSTVGMRSQGTTPASRILGDGLITTLTGHSGEVNAVAIPTNGKILASGSEDGTIQVWNLPTEEDEGEELLLRTLTGHSEGVRAIAISPDGQILISGSVDETINLWRLEAGELLQTLNAHIGGVRCIAISPDGQTFASGGQDKTIKLWNLHAGELLQTLTGHWGEVNSVAMSRDGQTLVSGSWDETIGLWNLTTGEMLNSLEGHQGAVASVAISPDGQTLVSSSWDNTIRVWGVR